MILSVIIKISSFFGLSPSNQCTAAKSCHADFLSVLHSLFCFTQFSRSYLPLNLRKHACTGSFPWFIPIFPPSCRSPPSTLRADRDVPIAYSALHRPALPCFSFARFVVTVTCGTGTAAAAATAVSIIVRSIRRRIPTTATAAGAVLAIAAVLCVRIAVHATVQFVVKVIPHIGT